MRIPLLNESVNVTIPFGSILRVDHTLQVHTSQATSSYFQTIDITYLPNEFDKQAPIPSTNNRST
jgi:hypothetical protein